MTRPGRPVLKIDVLVASDRWKKSAKQLPRTRLPRTQLPRRLQRKQPQRRRRRLYDAPSAALPRRSDRQARPSLPSFSPMILRYACSTAIGGVSTRPPMCCRFRPDLPIPISLPIPTGLPMPISRPMATTPPRTLAISCWRSRLSRAKRAAKASRSRTTSPTSPSMAFCISSAMTMSAIRTPRSWRMPSATYCVSLLSRIPIGRTPGRRGQPRSPPAGRRPKNLLSSGRLPPPNGAAAARANPEIHRDF